MSSEVEHDSESTSSFLDVITSSIGILIILVMIAGQRSKEFERVIAAAPLDAELSTAQAEALSLEQDVHRIDQQMQTVEAELARRSAERGQLSTLAAAVENELNQRRAALDAESAAKYDVERDLALAQEELKRLASQLEATEKDGEPTTIEVESYPTPISKTVDEHEVHFQLTGGRLALVPFDPLVDELRGTLRDYASKLHEQQELSDTLGPIGGFRLRYTIERHDTPRGSFMQVAYIEFIPTSSQLGEPIDQALAPRSKFRNKLEMLSPRQYTITVWTYPDSFADFRRLKKELYGLGYSVAARPLPDGMLIGASPQGSKSSAQ